MPNPFLIQTPVNLAHHFWKMILPDQAKILDATCGNGYDTLFLSQILKNKGFGEVYALDIQKKAIEKTYLRLKEHFNEKELQNIHLVHASHEDLDFLMNKAFDLIVYNLGYLPGSDQQLTTKLGTTLESLNQAVKLLNSGGYLSVTCYPGHEAGARETEGVINWAKNLSSAYEVCHHCWLNRSDKAPSLILIQRKLKLPS